MNRLQLVLDLLQADARIVAEPAKLTSSQMHDWAKGFVSWDVCDQVCCSVFLASSLAWRKVSEWAVRNEEFVRRAAFGLRTAKKEYGQLFSLFVLQLAFALPVHRAGI